MPLNFHLFQLPNVHLQLLNVHDVFSNICVTMSVPMLTSPLEILSFNIDFTFLAGTSVDMDMSLQFDKFNLKSKSKIYIHM